MTVTALFPVRMCKKKFLNIKLMDKFQQIYNCELVLCFYSLLANSKLAFTGANVIFEWDRVPDSHYCFKKGQLLVRKRNRGNQLSPSIAV
jgi:hypothetical protein